MRYQQTSLFKKTNRNKKTLSRAQRTNYITLTSYWRMCEIISCWIKFGGGKKAPSRTKVFSYQPLRLLTILAKSTEIWAMHVCMRWSVCVYMLVCVLVCAHVYVLVHTLCSNPFVTCSELFTGGEVTINCGQVDPVEVTEMKSTDIWLSLILFQITTCTYSFWFVYSSYFFFSKFFKSEMQNSLMECTDLPTTRDLSRLSLC